MIHTCLGHFPLNFLPSGNFPPNNHSGHSTQTFLPWKIPPPVAGRSLQPMGCLFSILWESYNINHFQPHETPQHKLPCLWYFWEFYGFLAIPSRCPSLVKNDMLALLVAFSCRQLIEFKGTFFWIPYCSISVWCKLGSETVFSWWCERCLILHLWNQRYVCRFLLWSDLHRLPCRFPGIHLWCKLTANCYFTAVSRVQRNMRMWANLEFFATHFINFYCKTNELFCEARVYIFRVT